MHSTGPVFRHCTPSIRALKCVQISFGYLQRFGLGPSAMEPMSGMTTNRKTEIAYTNSILDKRLPACFAAQRRRCLTLCQERGLVLVAGWRFETGTVFRCANHSDVRVLSETDDSIQRLLESRPTYESPAFHVCADHVLYSSNLT